MAENRSGGNGSVPPRLPRSRCAPSGCARRGPRFPSRAASR